MPELTAEEKQLMRGAYWSPHAVNFNWQDRLYAAGEALLAHREKEHQMDPNAGANQMTDAEIQRWRDDAFEAAAKICERYQVNSFVIGDIRALKSKLPAQENSLRPLNAQEQETVREFGEAVQREVIDPLVAKEKAQLYGNPAPSVEEQVYDPPCCRYHEQPTPPESD